MSKRIRQYIGLFSAIITYYFIHEGTHLLYALGVGAFKQIHFMGLGMQVDIYAERMTEQQLGMFCLLGSVATMIAAYTLVVLAERIGKIPSKCFKACMYYITIALLIIDPLYLSLLCGLFGGGDMNGISLLVPESIARIVYGIILVINVVLFFKIVFPTYKEAFADK